MSDFDKINDVEWHDGILLDTQVIFKNGYCNMILSVDVYNNNEKRREKLTVEFINIEDLILTLDAIELNDNRSAGNVSNAYIKKIDGKGKYKFFLYLSDGYLNLAFKCLRLVNSCAE